MSTSSRLNDVQGRAPCERQPLSQHGTAASLARAERQRRARLSPHAGEREPQEGVDWLGERIIPAAGEPGSNVAKPPGVPADTSPTDSRKGRAIESKRGAY
jgi:hypothetical protein